VAKGHFLDAASMFLDLQNRNITQPANLLMQPTPTICPAVLSFGSFVEHSARR